MKINKACMKKTLLSGVAVISLIVGLMGCGGIEGKDVEEIEKKKSDYRSVGT